MHLPKKPQKGLVTLGAMGKMAVARTRPLRDKIASLLFSLLFLFSFSFPSFFPLFFVLPFYLFFSLPSLLSVHLSLFFLPFFLPVTGCHYVTAPGLELTTPYVDMDLQLTELCLLLPPSSGTVPGVRTVFRLGTRTELPGGQ